MSEEKQFWLFNVNGDQLEKLGFKMRENGHKAVEETEKADLAVPDKAIKGERPEAERK